MSYSDDLIDKAKRQAPVLEHIAKTYRGFLSETQITALNYTSSLLKEMAEQIDHLESSIHKTYGKDLWD